MSQAPHGGIPLFNTDEQSVLDNFFNSPDDFNHAALKQPVFPFGYVPASHDSDTDAHSSANSHVNALSHANMHNTASVGNTHNLTPHEAFNFNDSDLSAAFSIHQFRNGQPSSTDRSSANNSAMHSNNPFSLGGEGSWGTLSSTNPFSMLPGSNHLSDVYHAAMNPPQGGPQGGDQSKQNQGAWLNMLPDELSALNKQSRDLNYNSGPVYGPPQGWQGPGFHPYPHAPNRPPVPAYGTDTSFSGSRYQSSSTAAEHDSKGGNLLGIPMVEQAARPGNVTPGGLPVVNGRFPATTQPGPHQAGASWGGMTARGPPPPQRSSEMQPRKRRLSQQEREEEDEWTPNQARSGRRSSTVVKQEEVEDEYEVTPNQQNKRRKSNQLGGLPMANFPAPTFPVPNYQPANYPSQTPDNFVEDEESANARRRRGIKKKENLSDHQKRANHIQSEKKRRELINKGYQDLNELVPSLQHGKSGLSRSECLAEVNTFLQALDRGSAKLMAKLKEMGVAGV